MVDLAPSLLRLVFALFLVVLNGFFVAAEFAFVRSVPPRSNSSSRRGAPARRASRT
jgi:CBS domain containing-hemolysin-like protein